MYSRHLSQDSGSLWSRRLKAEISTRPRNKRELITRQQPLEQSAARPHLTTFTVFRNRLKTYLFSESFPS